MMFYLPGCLVACPNIGQWPLGGTGNFFIHGKNQSFRHAVSLEGHLLLNVPPGNVPFLNVRKVQDTLGKALILLVFLWSWEEEEVKKFPTRTYRSSYLAFQKAAVDNKMSV